jgi:DNA-binding MarR family transcriptional regulator
MPSSAPVSELTAHLGFWLRDVSNHVSHAFAARMEGKGVTVAEWVLMRTLYGREPMAPSRVADAMGMTRGAITRLAGRLITKDFVTRTASPDDGRAQTLALTPQGAKLVPILAELADQNDAEFFSVLSGSERQTLERLLRRMVAEGRMRTTPVD